MPEEIQSINLERVQTKKEKTKRKSSVKVKEEAKAMMRLAVEQLDLNPGDLVDFWLKPATKDESGWRGCFQPLE